MKAKGTNPLEDSEQVALAQGLDVMGLLWTHVPNEGLRHPATGRRLKKKGLKRGVNDGRGIACFSTSRRRSRGTPPLRDELGPSPGSECLPVDAR